MKISQVAAQLYTVREFNKTAKDLAETARKIRAIGYQAVQISGIGPIAYEEVRKIMEAEGLVICATHERGDMIRKNPEEVIERLKTIGTTHTAFPHPGDLDFSDPKAVQSLIADLSHAGAVLKKEGLTLSYHNHAVEFVHFDGQPLLEVFRREIPSENLSFELDTYWVQYGGGNPVEWCERLAGRVPCLHLKDYGYSATEHKPMFSEIGKGNLDFPAIIAAAEKSGCQWYIVEQDICPGDPFDSLKISFDYIQSKLVTA